MIHLIKLCVGIGSVEELESYRAADMRHAAFYGPNRHFHRTRMMPRRRDEIIGQGALYWVIAGKIRCRQRIVALEAVTGEDGTGYCDIVMEANLIRTVPQQRRPFQGWRYFKPGDVPADLEGQLIADEDGHMAEELARLGLI